MTSRVNPIAASSLTIAVMCLLVAGCGLHQSKATTPSDGASASAPAQESGDSTKTRGAPSSSSLPPSGRPLPQVITLFEMTDSRLTSGKYFVAGSGYVEFDGGARMFAGRTRKVDPLLEITVATANRIALDQCRMLLVKRSFNDRAVRISGTGLFTSRAGVGDRQLGIVRLDTLAGCKLVPRS